MGPLPPVDALLHSGSLGQTQTQGSEDWAVCTEPLRLSSSITRPIYSFRRFTCHLLRTSLTLLDHLRRLLSSSSKSSGASLLEGVFRRRRPSHPRPANLPLAPPSQTRHRRRLSHMAEATVTLAGPPSPVRDCTTSVEEEEVWATVALLHTGAATSPFRQALCAWPPSLPQPPPEDYDGVGAQTDYAPPLLP